MDLSRGLPAPARPGRERREVAGDVGIKRVGVLRVQPASDRNPDPPCPRPLLSTARRAAIIAITVASVGAAGAAVARLAWREHKLYPEARLPASPPDHAMWPPAAARIACGDRGSGIGGGAGVRGGVSRRLGVRARAGHGAHLRGDHAVRS